MIISVPGSVFTFRPDGPTNAALDIYDDFDALYAACAPLRTAKLPFTVLFDGVECDIPTTAAYDLGGRATLRAEDEGGRGPVLVVFADGTSLKGFNKVSGPIELQSQVSSGAAPIQVGIASAVLVVEDRAKLSAAAYVPLFEVTGEGLLEIWLDNAQIVHVSSEVIKLGSVCSLRVRGSRGARVEDDTVLSTGTGTDRAQFAVIAIDAGTSLCTSQSTHTGYMTAEMPWMRELALFGARTVSQPGDAGGTYYLSLDGGDAAIFGEHSKWKVPSGNVPRALLGQVSVWLSVPGTAPAGHTLGIDVMLNGTAIPNFHLDLTVTDTATHVLFPEPGAIFLNQDDTIEVRVVHTGLTTSPMGLFVSLMGV